MSTNTIPNNTTTVDPRAAQEASSNAGSGSTAANHGPAVSTTGNNVSHVSPAEAETKGNLGGVKGIAAAVHGVGEKIRGTFNQAVDDVAHDPQGSAKNRNIASAGDNEIATGKFAASTKNREGALPGADHEARHNQANTDLNRE